MRPSALLPPLLLAACIGGGGDRSGPAGAEQAPVDCVLRYATPQELLILARGTVGDPRAARVVRDVRARPEAAACVAAALPPTPAAPPAGVAPGDDAVDAAIADALAGALAPEDPN
ncbi:hypothetical protein JQC91_05570 [Jannaschia sp. Os4]|uniref:hypothetical protein n=1 Tax=Jannaschia sp. Os4 TaxID=2807617 RepID=UPI001939567D|nr:hypothetical protein [Jannaschia sp. Os4]MBM2575769.1 hypothetical protein [Jannaschia sp. Os4]